MDHVTTDITIAIVGCRFIFSTLHMNKMRVTQYITPYKVNFYDLIGAYSFVGFLNFLCSKFVKSKIQSPKLSYKTQLSMEEGV